MARAVANPTVVGSGVALEAGQIATDLETVAARWDNLESMGHGLDATSSDDTCPGNAPGEVEFPNAGGDCNWGQQASRGHFQRASLTLARNERDPTDRDCQKSYLMHLYWTRIMTMLPAGR